MRTFQPTRLLRCCIFVAIILGLFSVAAAAEQGAYAGWEEDSPYNQYYNYKEKDSLKGTILQFEEVVPLPGMAPGTAFILEEGGEKILVHLCPVAYSAANDTDIRKGIKTKVNGCWAVIDGQDVFIAAKVKQGDSFVFKVRLTKDGKPFWTMGPEELAKEKAEN